MILIVQGCRATGSGEDYELQATSVNETARRQSEAFFAPDRLVEISITMQNWDVLRTLAPAGGRCNFRFTGSQYAWMAAEEVTVNGETFRNVGIKKRSHCGSLSDIKPNLGLKMDKHDKDNKERALATLGVNSLVLNNSKQDPSLVRQCLVYRLFARAGVPSPRCNYAHVTVNGQDMGAYVNVENMDAQAMARVYGLPLGNLYKIEVDEFKASHLERWAAHLEGFDDDTSASDVRAVIEAIESDRTEELSLLGDRVDFENYIKYWSMEMLVIHSDGMIRHNNNTYVYFRPEGKMVILPSGPDKTLIYDDDKPVHKMLYRKDFIAKRLLEKRAYRDRLKETIRSQLNQLWNDDALNKEIDKDLVLLQPLISSELKRSHDDSLAALRRNIKNRPAEMAEILTMIDEAGTGTPAP
jgi:Fe-S-cluster formation regulator IscX/YfhJ